MAADETKEERLPRLAMRRPGIYASRELAVCCHLEPVPAAEPPHTPPLKEGGLHKALDVA